ncbi:hypothetical protein GWI33_003187 [Rhynchophorus ferrugineus]|uniref:C-type lectin domain-containing protein n=1 Tax=Rhynchophorus ferrugineus TaxID=354439 RepID=A0A834MN28_RHYFE|nr:hypothetical protein GWI33_003187 [Rhynchophorus ferrugineus]
MSLKVFIFIFSLCSITLCKNLTNRQNKSDAMESSASELEYIVSDEKVNFFKAIISCLEADMELATVLNKEQQERLDYSLRESLTQEGYWLSGTNLPEPDIKQYYWLTGGKKAVYTNWLPEEPKLDVDEHCISWLEKENGIGWSVQNCYAELQYVCQYNPYKQT